jgi:hypothetical protein
MNTAKDFLLSVGFEEYNHFTIILDGFPFLVRIGWFKLYRLPKGLLAFNPITKEYLAMGINFDDVDLDPFIEYLLDEWDNIVHSIKSAKKHNGEIL